LAFEHDFVGKSKMAEILGWVENQFFYLKNSKIEIFQKTLPLFVVLSSINFLLKSVFVPPKWRHNSRWRIDFYEKIFMFLGKNKRLEKNSK
jgi:hypothetical protein